jgi:hypothetical protein
MSARCRFASIPLRARTLWSRAPIAGILASMLLAGACSGSRVARQPGPAANVKREAPPFISFNIPNLHYIEDVARFDTLQRQRLPDPYEIRDALETIRLMGGNVVRIDVLSVKKATDPRDVVRHVMAPGQFNEAAFVSLDQVLAVAAELGLRGLQAGSRAPPRRQRQSHRLPTRRAARIAADLRLRRPPRAGSRAGLVARRPRAREAAGDRGVLQCSR